MPVDNEEDNNVAKSESPSDKQEVDEPEVKEPEVGEPEADEQVVDEPEGDEPESCGEAPSKLEEAGAKIGGGISAAETLPVFEAGLVQEDQGSKALAGQDQVPML